MKPLVAIAVKPPAVRVRRDAHFAAPGERANRYTLPERLDSASPVGYRTRVPMTAAEIELVLPLLSLARPSVFVPGPAPTDGELFDECALGVLSARQSTNFRGHRSVVLGPEDSARAAAILKKLSCEAPVLDRATHTHVVLSRPYRTAFTFLLTFIGHRAFTSLLTVPLRAWNKRFHHQDDIPTIGYLQQLHIGILADAMERAAVIASGGTRRAQVFQTPFCGDEHSAVAELEALCGVSAADRRDGWRIAIVAQVGAASEAERIDLPGDVARKLGANLMAFRSERIQPGVNAEDKAPPAYQTRQDMDVPDELTEQAGRAAYNAFAHWAAFDREKSKELLLLERVDVLTPNGKARLRAIRDQLGDITDSVVNGLPLWVDLPTGRALSKNAARGRKAFALAGQRIYIVGLSQSEVSRAGIPWNLAVRAVGAACSRGGLYAELMGVRDLPADCDLLAGICLMAGPINQNDIGKAFFGKSDLLADAFPGRDPTSLLVWTLKAKTVADPIGNEEQLMNKARQGALVDLRPAPEDVVRVRRGGSVAQFRPGGSERAYADVGNFVTDADGREIANNRGTPHAGRDAAVW